MSRENKLALIIGFGLVLFIGVLISDHLSEANRQVTADLAMAIDPLVDDADAPFTIRNLDTGEAVALQVGGEQLVWEQLSYSTLSSNPAAWEALKAESKGLLEKLASKSTFSIRSYQLCVWQERCVFAADDALCYQHLSADMQPTGKQKRIPYSTIEFVGPFDDTQFGVKCARRAYTFLCDSTDTRNKWIVNISKLSGCSSSTQVCHKTTTMGH